MENVSDFIENGTVSKAGIQEIERLIQENKELKEAFAYHEQTTIFGGEPTLFLTKERYKSELIDENNRLSDNIAMISSNCDKLKNEIQNIGSLLSKGKSGRRKVPMNYENIIAHIHEIIDINECKIGVIRDYETMTIREFRRYKRKNKINSNFDHNDIDRDD